MTTHHDDILLEIDQCKWWLVAADGSEQAYDHRPNKQEIDEFRNRINEKKGKGERYGKNIRV